ncbi:hypothetical protein V0288_14685 [Pannus brasiliensis CCIBt3594]|uniref:Uncharacterized protein n=1 Tax=Pannus brasiliensis CCIBt3594 TaxID=1427578 RepID=A0AAW9QZB8_9CHRO
MKPRFKNRLAWEQAERLMQPAFIRVLDNLRKQLENSPWAGTFQEIETPYPGYRLCLTRGEHSTTVDLWDLCFRICFLDYPADESGESQEIDIDTALLDETGEVDWHGLETKTDRVIRQLFANLPTDEV